jgi:uncharacterized membrane protein YjjP (DUF1212 family)
VDNQPGMLTIQVAADPAGVEMDRVASAMRAIDAIEAGRLTADAAMKRIEEISHAAPAPTWLFALAAAAGAVALAMIFGVQHMSAATLIVVSAGAGALLRRNLGVGAVISSCSRSARPPLPGSFPTEDHGVP